MCVLIISKGGMSEPELKQMRWSRTVMYEKVKNIQCAENWIKRLCTYRMEPWLPDFSCHNIPKRRKMHQIATELPNEHKIYQMAIEYTNLFHSKALKNLPKLGFWF
jgi:hypothetical protein